jgi:hypothetical protein
MNQEILFRVMSAGIMSRTRKQVLIQWSAMKTTFILIDGVRIPDCAGAYDPYYFPANEPAPTG